MSEAKLTIKIENKKPIELIDFTDSFSSLGNQYYKFLSENDDFSVKPETKLYIKEIKWLFYKFILSFIILTNILQNCNKI